MPPRVPSKRSSSSPIVATLRSRSLILGRLNDPEDVTAAVFVSVLLCVGEIVLCALIVWKVPYTEIDWKAYMSEVGGYLDGERDYTKLRGDTGPLVYPAGFVYIYAALAKVTGGDILTGQVIFIGVYVLHLAVVLAVYVRAKVVPPWALVTLCLSKRVHSIFVLRLFNDCIAMLFAYVAVLLFQSRRWVVGAAMFSLGVSVKMNVLLMLPPLLVLLVGGARFTTALSAAIAFVGVQLALGYPFLTTYPSQYVAKAFEFSRQFIYHWSVNWKFVPEDVFLSKPFARVLLALHLVALLALAHRRWHEHGGGFFPAFIVDFFRRLPSNAAPGKRVSNVSPAHVAGVLMEGNFVGVLFARTLHYQFYEWYFHSIPLLLWRSGSSLPGGAAVKLGIMLAVEYCWNVFPSTPRSSGILFVAHVVLFAAVWFSKPPPPTAAARASGGGGGGGGGAGGGGGKKGKKSGGGGDNDDDDDVAVAVAVGGGYGSVFDEVEDDERTTARRSSARMRRAKKQS